MRDSLAAKKTRWYSISAVGEPVDLSFNGFTRGAETWHKVDQLTVD